MTLTPSDVKEIKSQHQPAEQGIATAARSFEPRV
jgi:hypothetical protein